MRDDDRGGGVSDPTVAKLLEWRKDPTAQATIALCDELRVRPTKTLVGFVAKVVARQHWEDPSVVRALGRLQLSAGLLAQSRLSFVRAARLDFLAKPATRPEPPPPSSSGLMSRVDEPHDPPTTEHGPPQFLLDLLRGIDDDEAIATVAESTRPPMPNRKRSVDRIAALNVPIAGGTVPLLDPPRRTENGGLRAPETRSSDPSPIT